ncbi:50S ribosomal protein L34e [Candidatus Woesearchaeota archaeon]|jgi:large subunit ribosomal protein L34e|nr:50S ribosomal protein L34e [Candidatus Woesearchaeota archaeon]
MPAGRHKSRTFRRVFIRVISKTKKIYKKRNPKIAHCADCKSELKGIPRLRPYKAMTIAKTKKRPERPYGGKLCSKCTRLLLKSKVREDV